MLREWLEHTRLTPEEAGSRFGCSAHQIRHMVQKNPRAPGRKLATRIVEVTLGAVGYDDLFPPETERAAS